MDRLLKRGNGWASRHARELGGYEDEGRLRFPLWGIQRWQRRKEEATR